MFTKGLSKAKITALAVALCMISMGMRENSTVANASSLKTTYMWPVPDSTEIINPYSEENDGIDIVSDEPDTRVVASRKGTVEVAKSTDCEHVKNYPNYCCNNGMGNYVKIRHEDGTYALYTHLKYGSVTVSEGQSVDAGQNIGIMGASGRTERVCLHFSLASSFKNKINTNPDVLRYEYSADNASKEESEVWVINASSGVNFRSGAGTSFKKIGKIPKNEKVSVESKVDIEGSQWGKTTYEGINGWFALEYANILESGEKTSNNIKSSKDIYCDLELDPNGGDCEYSSYMYTKGSEVGILPEPKRSGYTFVGWYTKKNEGTEVNSQYKVSEDTTVYAHWK